MSKFQPLPSTNCFATKLLGEVLRFYLFERVYLSTEACAFLTGLFVDEVEGRKGLGPLPLSLSPLLPPFPSVMLVSWGAVCPASSFLNSLKNSLTINPGLLLVE